MTRAGRLSRSELAKLPTGSSAELPRMDRFWKRVTTPKTGCWEWTGTQNGYGYGVVSRQVNGERRQRMAHRVAYEALVGPIPEGLTLDHLCRNTSCVNPDHLEPVTGRVNILRGFGPSAMYARRDRCNRGHVFPGKRDARGSRVCPECVRQTNAANYAKDREKRGRGPHNRDKTHCKRGHEFTPENTRPKSNGGRECLACERIRDRINHPRRGA